MGEGSQGAGRRAGDLQMDGLPFMLRPEGIFQAGGGLGVQVLLLSLPSLQYNPPFQYYMCLGLHYLAEGCLGFDGGGGEAVGGGGETAGGGEPLGGG